MCKNKPNFRFTAETAGNAEEENIYRANAMINRHNNKFSVSSAISAVNEKTKPIALTNVGSAQRRTGHAKLDGERTDARRGGGRYKRLL